MTSSTPGRRLLQSPALPYAGLLLAAWFRLQQLEALPIYWDEAFHIYFARAPYLTGQIFSVFPFARWLNVMLIALFQPMGLESLWIARVLSVLLSFVSAACAYRLGVFLGGRNSGRWALALYLLMPFAFFYDRQAMSDPIMAAFGALSIVLSVQALRQLRWRDALLGGLCLGLAAVTKFAGLLYLPVMAAGILFLPVSNRRRAAGLAAGQAAVCIGLFALVFLLARLENGPGNAPAGANNWCHSPMCAGHFDPVQIIGLTATNLRLYADMIPSFYTPALWLLALGALFMAPAELRRRTLFLAVPAFALGLPYIVIADLFPPRYLAFTLVPIAALAAGGFVFLLNLFSQRLSAGAWPALVQVLVGACVLGTMVVLDVWQIAQPLTAPMPAWEKNQYAAGWPNGRAARAIVADLRTLENQYGQRINVLAGGFYLELYAYWGQRLGQVQTTRDVVEQTYIPWLAGNSPVCVVELLPKFALGENPFGFVLTTVKIYDVPDSAAHVDQFGGPAQARLACVTGTTAPLSKKIADYVFGDPASAATFYPAAAQSLRGFTGPVLLYPPNQLDILRAQPDITSADLLPVGNSWPHDLKALETQLSTAASKADEVRVVLAFGQRGDPGQAVERWLDANLFPIDVQFSGPVRVLRFLTSLHPDPAGASPSGPALPGLGRLAQAQILDSQVPASRLVRVQLTWLPDGPSGVSYKSFTHVFNSQGQLVAQHDAFPQSGFALTTAWQPGAPVVDRFVIYFPPDLPTGAYTVRTGLYDPDSGQRLTTADGADTIELGQVIIH